MGGEEEEGRKLKDQLTGFVETKLAGGIQGDEHGGPQTDNKHCIPEGKSREMRM